MINHPFPNEPLNSEKSTEFAEEPAEILSADSMECISENPVLRDFLSPVKYRIGNVQFLNSVPLTWKLKEIGASLNVEVDLEFDTPARLADKLIQGEVDAALVPIAEAIRHPELVQVSDVCIASEGNVASIEFLTLKPLDEIQKVGLDPASRTSNALLQICLAEKFKLNCEYEPFDVGSALNVQDEETEDLNFSDEEMCKKLAEVCRANGLDGLLLIGDKALTLQTRSEHFYCVYDLGQVWTQWIGLPFVFASWFTCRKAPEDWERLSMLFNESRRASQIEMDVLTIYEALKRRMDIRNCHDYLTRKIRFRLGGRERRGAEVFCKMTQKYGLAPLGANLEFEANRKRFADQD